MLEDGKGKKKLFYEVDAIRIAKKMELWFGPL